MKITPECSGGGLIAICTVCGRTGVDSCICDEFDPKVYEVVVHVSSGCGCGE